MPAETFSELLALAREHEKRAAAAADCSDDACDGHDHDDEAEAYMAARAAYQQALAAEPANAAALYHVARCDLILANMGDEESDDDASEEGSAGGDLEGLRLEKFNDAIVKMRQALSMRADYSECMFSLAEALIARADLRVELAEDEIAEEDEAEDPVVVARRTANEDLTEACKFFDQAYALFETAVGTANEDGEDISATTLKNTLVGHAEALSSRAYLARDKATVESLFAEAVTKVEKAVAVSPEHKSELLQEWAGVLEARADKLAEGDDEEGAMLTSRDNIPDYTPALAKLDEAIAADAKNASAWFDRAQILMSSVHHELLIAATSTDDINDVDGDDEELEYPEAIQTKVWGLYTDAKTALEKASEIDTKSVEICVKAGDLCFAMARLEMSCARPHRAQLDKEAEAWFRKALELDPEDEQAVPRLAQSIFFAQGGEDGGSERDEEVLKYLGNFKRLGGDLDDLLDDPEIFEEEFIAFAGNRVFPDGAWEDEDDSDESGESDD